MVKSKLISKTPKKSMNAMEAYRKKEKNKEKNKVKNKKNQFHHKEGRQKDEEHKPKQPYVVSNKPYGARDDDDDDFEGQGDLLEFNAMVQQKLQEKQRIRDLKYDDTGMKNSIQDLVQNFTKRPTFPQSQDKPVTAGPSTAVRQGAPSSLSSFMGDNILRAHGAGDPHKPVFPQSQGQHSQGDPMSSKSGVGDKRLQKRDGAGSVDPFMMSTIEGNYDPRNRKKQEEAVDPMLGNYVSQAPGVYKAMEKTQNMRPANVSAAPTVIVKEAALTSAPLRSQMEKEKSTLIPMNVVKKKPVKPTNEEVNKPNQSTMNIGIMNVTNVPAPKTNFGFSQNIQQNAAQKEELSAFLQEISQLEDGM